MRIGTGSNHDLLFRTNGSERMRVLSGGNVGIGITTAAEKLQVFGDIRVGTTGTNGCLQNFAGTAIAGTCSSDENLKMEIEDVSSNTLEKFSQLRFITYKWNGVAQEQYKKDGNVKNTGLLAQQVERVFPELVSTDDRGYKVIDLTTLFVYAMQSIRDLALKVEIFATKLITKEVVTETLCVGIESDKTCITKGQLDQLLSGQQIQGLIDNSDSPGTITLPALTGTSTEEADSQGQVETSINEIQGVDQGDEIASEPSQNIPENSTTEVLRQVAEEIPAN